MFHLIGTNANKRKVVGRRSEKDISEWRYVSKIFRAWSNLHLWSAKKYSFQNSLHDPDRSNTKSINGMFIISITQHCIVHYCLLLSSTPLNSIPSSHTLLYPRMVATQMEKEVSNEMKQIGLNLSKEMLSKCKFPFFWSILQLN